MPLEISDVLDHHFTKIRPRFTNVMPATDATFWEYINPTQNNFSIKETNNSAVHKLRLSLPLNKGKGLDGISCRLLKGAAPIKTPLLTSIINLSISTGIFSDNWKIARVSLGYKETIKSDPNNYRPISVLPIINRIVETIAFNQHLYLSNWKWSPSRFSTWF